MILPFVFALPRPTRRHTARQVQNAAVVRVAPRVISLPVPTRFPVMAAFGLLLVPACLIAAQALETVSAGCTDRHPVTTCTTLGGKRNEVACMQWDVELGKNAWTFHLKQRGNGDVCYKVSGSPAKDYEVDCFAAGVAGTLLRLAVKAAEQDTDETCFAGETASELVLPLPLRRGRMSIAAAPKRIKHTDRAHGPCTPMPHGVAMPPAHPASGALRC